MNYRTILVPVEPPPAAVGHVVCAKDLADKFDGRLLGVGAEAHPLLSADPTGLAEHDLKDRIAAWRRERLDAAEREFARLAGKSRLWRCEVATMTQAVLAHARRADLVVLEAPRSGAVDQVDFGRILLGVGTPVLLVRPDAEQVRGRYVVVAWKDTREARRAIRDALPFLQMAKEVTLCSIAEGDTASEAASLADIRDRLRSHSVNAYSLHIDPPAHPGVALMESVRQAGADLIVAGAYSRGRLNELVFGGFTRHLLRQSECSVLFSH